MAAFKIYYQCMLADMPRDHHRDVVAAACWLEEIVEESAYIFQTGAF